MKRIILVVSVFLLPVLASAIPSLPAPRCAGSSVVYGDTIYYFGGSNDWAGTYCYSNVYRYNGTRWDTVHTQLPDTNTWGGNAVIVHDTVYYVSGWPNNAGGIRRYSITANSWNTTGLPSCANTQSWGTTSQLINRMVYLFSGDGTLYRFSVDSNRWSSDSARWGLPLDGYLTSVIYNNEIYVLGYSDRQFGKFNPTTHRWTQLATPIIGTDTVSLQAGCMAVLGNRIYVAASVSDASVSTFTTNRLIYSYSPSTNQWNLDSAVMSSGRAWCATAMYRGGFYILGGLVNDSTALDSVTQVVPRGFSTAPERMQFALPAELRITVFPNPFNPLTSISVSSITRVRLSIYNQLGQQVATRTSEGVVGSFRWDWNAASLPSGVYYLHAVTDIQQKTIPLLLVK